MTIASRLMALALALDVVCGGALVVGQGARAPESCFLLYDEESGRPPREPSAACATRATPASTFKIAHALAALDAGVISGAHDTLRYDGAPLRNERWKRDHDLSSAMRDSVVWYFQRIAERMGAEREQAYLKAFQYGNQDASGPLTSFWLGSSLQISPEEQLAFLQRLFERRLPARQDAVRTVLDVLVQPEGHIVNATGQHPLGTAWSAGTTVHAKTGAGADDDRSVVWLVGRVTRAGRTWMFVSCVLGSDDPLAAVKLAGVRLTQSKVL